MTPQEQAQLFAAMDASTATYNSAGGPGYKKPTNALLGSSPSGGLGSIFPDQHLGQTAIPDSGTYDPITGTYGNTQYENTAAPQLPWMGNTQPAGGAALPGINPSGDPSYRPPTGGGYPQSTYPQQNPQQQVTQQNTWPGTYIPLNAPIESAEDARARAQRLAGIPPTGGGYPQSTYQQQTPQQPSMARPQNPFLSQTTYGAPPSPPRNSLLRGIGTPRNPFTRY